MPKGQYDRNKAVTLNSDDQIRDLKQQIEQLKAEKDDLFKQLAEKAPIDPAAMLVGLAVYFQLKATRDRLSPPPLIVTTLANGSNQFMAQPDRQTMEIKIQTAADCYGTPRGAVTHKVYTMEQFETLTI